MSNQYRLEQDRDLLLLIDAGRLSSAPIGDQHMTILDAELDAAAALAFVADELGDRCGAVAFDDEVRAALPPRRQGGSDVVRALFDLEPRPQRQRLRARVQARRGLQARARRRPVRPARGGRGALARARGPGAHPPPRGDGRQPVGPRARGAGRRRAQRPTPSTRRPRHDRRRRPRTPALAPRRRSGPRAPACSRRRRTGSPRRSSPPTCGPRPAPCSERSRPRHTTSPQNTTNRKNPSAAWNATGSSGPVAKPSRKPHSTSHGAVPTAISTAGRASRRSAVPRRTTPGRISAQPTRSPATPPHDDARDLQRPVRGDQPQERDPVAGADREPGDHAQDQPVEAQRPDRQRPERDPAHERQQRHLDVVEHHLERERRRRLGVEVAALDRRVGGGLELGRDQARGRRRVDQRPRRRPAAPARAAAPTRRTAAPAARPAAASSRATGSSRPTRAGPRARRPSRGRAAPAAPAARSAGRRDSAGARTRGPRRPPDRARRAAGRRPPRAAPAGRFATPQHRVELTPGRARARPRTAARSPGISGPRQNAAAPGMITREIMERIGLHAPWSMRIDGRSPRRKACSSRFRSRASPRASWR